MPVKLEMNIKCGESLHSNMGSLLQGVLMELIEPEYAAYLHSRDLLPYSQYLSVTKFGEAVWCVSTLDDESCEKIIVPLTEKIVSGDTFEISRKGICFSIGEYRVRKFTYKEFVDAYFIPEETSRRGGVILVTPCAFKSDGRYQNIPGVRWVIQSLMHRFDAYSDTVKTYDPEALEHICKHTNISRFSLRSASFPLERVKIPSFVGQLEFYTSGSTTMAGLVNMLLRFGDYSGIGIKTAMGMGGAFYNG
ncbi:MAG: CRISPR system precrRNA processing endoribonuclease RAMP protein Cas6 [Clostridiales bacterium]|nr:CRISPR system precrRNA processing endoribonuclease RAMP protein Cas6 [Clostridiales bacterium]